MLTNLVYSTNPGIPISPPGSPVLGQPVPVSFSPTTCYLTRADSVLLTVSDITPYLDAALLAMGLHTEARTSFITPPETRTRRAAVRTTAEYEAAAHLDITPVPNVITHVFMLFKGIVPENLGE
ncbi:hypothetical protein DFH07DRAFT_958800 [Mycena maculata]|uniref:Uncharacterized protein n=1 Tax=Mycena maculata TaxID=230809 RepID=A0AAD7NE95_9AGAR|nr:hypothetical protein DFH07DRAFT_958800 [Mycena maculata]